MKAAEIREMSTPEIQARLNDAREELMKLRFQQATGELTDTSQMKQTRRTIARLLTILAERERQAQMEGEA
ncbi:MAG: 50S ribosomal protein L29 [Anaerolineae bacterium]|nr:MAG: 50S ribosomal protein L29 [Anaerolineae bacterium]